MSPKQHDFIVSLAGERVLPEGAQGDYVRSLVAGTARTPDRDQASRIIEWLLALPRQAAGGADVPAGRYALVHPERGHVEFFRVDRPEEGKWAGYTFVKQQASDDLYPVKGARAKEILSRIAEDPHAALIRYGHELGCCGRCGRTLTDEVSRAMGIGPECASILGIGRPNASEVAAPAAAPPAPAPEPEPEAETSTAWSIEAYQAPSTPRNVLAPEVYVGWRQRARLLRAEVGTPTRTGPLSQIQGELPGSSWEEIFS